MKCALVSYVRYINNMACGTSEAATFCHTHSMEVAGPATVNGMCSIGRIEQATDEALDRIRAALDNPSQITPHKAGS